MDDPAIPEPERPGSSPPAQLDVAGVRRAWDEILRMVNDRKKRIAALARNATVRDLDGDTLVLTFQSSALASMMAKEASVLSDAIYEVLGARWELRCEVAGDQRPSPAAPPARPAPVPEKKPERTEDWPEPARPGGVDPKPQATAAPEAPPPAARAESNGLAAARAAAAGRGVRTPASSPADNSWAGEPPYDPDYDSPRPNAAAPSAPQAAAAYEGFDPGDEPTDEVVDERTARQSSEQQAMQLLQQTFGAEKIGEV
jgi:DNA polymerase-3 subunit gamma/tau